MCRHPGKAKPFRTAGRQSRCSDPTGQAQFGQADSAAPLRTAPHDCPPSGGGTVLTRGLPQVGAHEIGDSYQQ